MGFSVVDIVTGATQGIGRAIADSIAHTTQQDPKHHALFLVGRNSFRGNQVAESLRNSSGRESIFFEQCDLSDWSQVLELKGRIAKQMDQDFRVHCLVNCAAECPKQQILVDRPTIEGVTEKVDRQFASNVLGYHFMMKAFQENFQDSFVVNIASNWAGDLRLDDLHFCKRPYDNDTAYRQSKQSDRMLTKAWADRLRESGTIVNSCHPGDPCTILSKDLGYNLWASPPTREAIESQTAIPFLCGYRGNLKTSAGWFDGGETTRSCRFMKMEQECQLLYDFCDKYCT
jgi:NAD(P)-dependent dehydrogenase (short-subunit alcohol dehydrogenase family)